MQDHADEDVSQLAPWQQKLHRIIFGYKTFSGKLFDIVLLVLILLSIVAVMLESVQAISLKYGTALRIVEWVFTIFFTAEYVARLSSSPKPSKYIWSFMGIIDFLSIMPSYLSFFIVGSQSLMVLRSVRLIRVFRILKLARYMKGANQISSALWNSRHKITVFLGSILCIVVIIGSLMFLIEEGENGFNSIPRSVYWAIVTLTTVGYGDIAPQTIMGQTLASIVMILGYAIIAVPTGIVTNEIIKNPPKSKTKKCNVCKADNLEEDSLFCRFCGEALV